MGLVSCSEIILICLHFLYLILSFLVYRRYASSLSHNNVVWLFIHLYITRWCFGCFDGLRVNRRKIIRSLLIRSLFVSLYITGNGWKIFTSVSYLFEKLLKRFRSSLNVADISLLKDGKDKQIMNHPLFTSTGINKVFFQEFTKHLKKACESCLLT